MDDIVNIVIVINKYQQMIENSSLYASCFQFTSRTFIVHNHLYRSQTIRIRFIRNCTQRQVLLQRKWKR